MTHNEFMTELEFVFNLADGTLKSETELRTLKTWDSIGMLAVLTLLKETGAKIQINELRNSKTINDLVQLAAAELK